MDFRLESRGLGSILSALTSIPSTVQKNLDKSLKLTGVYMQKSIDTNFREEGRPNKWEPLSPFTLAMRRKGSGKGSGKILQDTGRLKNSITFKVERDKVKIGTNVEYAPYQHYGMSNAWGKGIRVPARPFVMWQEEDKPIVDKIFIDNCLMSIKWKG